MPQEVHLGRKCAAVRRERSALVRRLGTARDFGRRDEAVAVNVAVGVGEVPVPAQRIARLVSLRGAAQAENDRLDRRIAERDEPVAVTPGARRDAPPKVGRLDDLRRRLNLHSLVADLAEVQELVRGAPQRRRPPHGDEGVF